MPTWRTNGSSTPLAGTVFPQTPVPREPVGFERRQPVRTLDELIVPKDVPERIRQALTLITHRETLLETWKLGRLLPHRTGMAINLYGPPGTGKTHCAEAIAAFLGREMLVVDYTALVSKYVGDTQKHISSAFRAAERTSALLFFDEADALLTARDRSGGDAGDSANLSRSVLLSELDRGSSLVIFATNRADEYDSAFVRRILAHIEMPLPDEATRVRLWAHVLVDELPRATDVDPSGLAAQSEGLSGGDMVNVIVRAAARAVQRDVAERCVTVEDLTTEIEVVRSAARHVGTPWQQS